jgi:hypothetical protein
MEGLLMWIIHRDHWQFEPLEYYKFNPLSINLLNISDTIPIIIAVMDGLLLVCYTLFET